MLDGSNKCCFGVTVTFVLNDCGKILRPSWLYALWVLQSHLFLWKCMCHPSVGMCTWQGHGELSVSWALLGVMGPPACRQGGSPWTETLRKLSESTPSTEMCEAVRCSGGLRKTRAGFMGWGKRGQVGVGECLQLGEPSPADRWALGNPRGAASIRFSCHFFSGAASLWLHVKCMHDDQEDTM